MDSSTSLSPSLVHFLISLREFRWVALNILIHSFTCVADRFHGIEPYAYLKRLFTELPQASTVEDIEALLPIQNIEAQREAA